jgi:sodium transport system permease protein
MLSWTNVKLIFLREVRDQLRDRRTLFMIAVLPLLLYPALGIGMMQLTTTFREQPRTVVVVGARDLPEKPQLLQGGRFAHAWFDDDDNPEKLEVVSDLEESSGEDAASPESARRATLLRHARAIRAAVEKAERLDGKDPAAKAERQKVGELFETGRIEVLVIIPDGFGRRLQEFNRRLAEQGSVDESVANYPRPEIIYSEADEKSHLTYRRVREVFRKWEDSLLEERLVLARLDRKFPHPVDPDPVDVALDEQLAAGLWGKLFPALLVIMAITGAFYPAIDLVAGEKERGTMETLLICPATRTEIVLGKFFTVLMFSCATVVLNMMSLGMTGRHIASMAPSGKFGGVDLAFPPFSSLFWLFVLMLPVAALFSALCLALATFARSSKEGQYYLTPLLMVTLGLTIFCLSPGVDLTPQYSILPVMGVALLLKGLLLSPLHAESLYVYLLPVLLTSIGYSALALWWAIDQFNREEVLFREAERFDLALWIRHLLRDKEPTPSFTEAGFCFIIIMLLQFGSLKAFGGAASTGGSHDVIPPMYRALLTQQLAIIAAPALFMAIMLTTSLRQTLRLYLPDIRVLAAALVLPFALHPLTVELQSHLRWFFDPLPEGIQKVMASMSDDRYPLWLVIGTFALAPAVCEELAFRGFMLSGFLRRHRTWLAVGISSVAFGLMHMIPQQVFNASLLGVVLGLIAVRGNSLLPCIGFHFVNNTLAVLHGRFGAEWAGQPHLRPFISGDGKEFHYQWPTLLVCALVAVPLISWLVGPLCAKPAGHESSGVADLGVPDSVARLPS